MKVPSITKTNHRYRGTMESDKHTITLHQVIHDVRELYHLIHRNPADDTPGQYEYIPHNMQRTVSWWRLEASEEDSAYSNRPLNTTVYGPGWSRSMQLLPLESLDPLDTLPEIVGIRGKLNTLSQRARTIFDQL